MAARNQPNSSNADDSGRGSATVRGERVEFASRRGSLLVGDLHRSIEPNGTALILCHGMESTRVGTKQEAMVERFVPLGYTVLRFDFSYVGESDGRFADITISGEVSDVFGALDFLEEFRPQRTVLIGSSLGGAVALVAAAQAAQRVDAVATIAAVADTNLFVEELSEQEIRHWRESGKRQWRDGHIKSTFLDDVLSLDIPKLVSTLQCPLLVMHGDNDDVVPPSHARTIERSARGPVEVVMFPGVGHRFEEPGALGELLETTDGWLAEVVEGDASA